MSNRVFYNIYGEVDEYEGKDKIEHFYTDYIEFKDFIELRIIDYKRYFKDKPVMFSLYPTTIEQLMKLLTFYNNERYNVYVGSNTRTVKSRKDKDIDYRRTFYIDLEGVGEKPPLSNETYYKKLLITVNHLRFLLDKKGLRINCLKESGRGLHIGFKIKPLEREVYEEKFKKFFRDLIKYLSKDMVFDDIKFSDSVFNISRIESAPGTIHYKYPEKPYRRVLFLSNKINDIQPLLDVMKLPKRRSLVFESRFSKRYNNKTIFKAPEVKLIDMYDDLPEGELHTRIILQIKILIRDNNIDKDMMQNFLSQKGYCEVIDTPDEELYRYNPMSYNVWCFNNVEYCYENKIPLILEPFEVFRVSGVKYVPYEDFSGEKKPFDKPITTLNDLLNYIRAFNRLTSYEDNSTLYVHRDRILEGIKRNSSKEFYGYIENNKPLFEMICAVTTTKKLIEREEKP